MLAAASAICFAVFCAPAWADAPKVNISSSFSVSSSGAFTYTVPLVTPPGTAGMTPTLSLDYSSQTGTGLEGIGFRLSGVPAISRCPQTIAQDGYNGVATDHGAVNFDSHDHFCLEGQRLVKLTAGASQAVQASCTADGSNTPVEYRTEIDGFSRIASCGQDSASTGPLYFRVWTKTGQVMDFGNSVDSRLHPVGYDETTGRTGPIPAYSVWGVNKITDVKKNYLLVIYNCAPSGNACTDTDRAQNGQMYPIEITYTGTASTLPYNSVQFNYVDRVSPYGYPDKVAQFHAGTVQKMTKLLGSVVMCTSTQMQCPTANIVRQYGLTYGWDYAATDTPVSCCARISQITECAASLQTCLLPTKLYWSGENSMDRYPSLDGHTNNTAFGKTTGKPNNFNADFNGDGLTDMAVLIPDDKECDYHTLNPTPYFATNVYNNTFPADGWEFDAHIPPPSGPFSQVDYGSNQNNFNCGSSASPKVASFYNTLTFVMDYDGDGYSDISEVDHTDDDYRWVLHNDRTGSFAATPNAYLWHAAPPWGDYNGDGRSDYVYRPSSPPNTMTPRFSLSTGGGDPVFVASGVTATVQDGDFLEAGDFDGDGCADILWLKQQSGNPEESLTTYCHTGTGTFSQTCNEAPAGNNFFRMCKLPDLPIINSSRRHVLGDFNGDGKTDVFVYGGDADSVLYASTGASFTAVNPHLPGIYSDYVATAGDFNGDGRADIELTPPQSRGTQVWVFLSVPEADGGDGIDQIPIFNSNLYIAGTTRGAVAADWNSDGNDDLWLQSSNGDRQVIFDYGGPHLLKQIDNGLGIVTYVTYDRINHSTSLYAKASDAAYPTQDIDGPFYVVKEVDSGNGINDCYAPSSCYRSSYSYAGLKASLTGRGLLGFSSVTITDLTTGIVQQSNYYTQFPFTGLLKSQTKTCPSSVCSTSVVLESTQNCYQQGACTDNNAPPTALTLSGGDINRYFIPLRRTTVTTQDTDGTSQFGTTTTGYVYDCDGGLPCYGLTNQVTVSKVLGSDSTSKVTTNTYIPVTGSFLTNWFVDRLQQASVAASNGTSTITRTSSFLYNSDTGLLTDETVEPGDAACSYLNTHYDYDPLGNKSKATVSSYNHACGADRWTQTTWNAGGTDHGAFPTVITNVKNQSEYWTYDPRFGTPLTHQGPNEHVNNKQTTWSYDAFGRKTQEIRPDGNQTFYDYGACQPDQTHPLPAGESCPTSGRPKFWAYSVSTNATGSLVQGQVQGQNGPYAVVFYDGLARPIATDTQAFDGAWVRVSTVYDTKGRVVKTSRPYCLVAGSSSCNHDLGADTAQWTVNCYKTTVVCNGSEQPTDPEDPEGRVQIVTYPDTATDTLEYHGLVSSISRHDPVTGATHKTTTTLDARRDVVKVVDANNKATNYDYDVFENLVQIRAPASITTINTYDAFARRKLSTADPDMGTWHYTYDAFGDVVTQTDQKNQTTTMAYDALGRMVQRVEGAANEVWVYDIGDNSLGKLHSSCVRSDSGTNCSSMINSDYRKVYDYDTLDRPVGVTLKIDQIQYVYSANYDPDGRLNQFTYPSGFKTRSIYQPTVGGMCRLVDDASTATDCTSAASQVYWTANIRDQEGRLTLQTAGNGVQTSELFYATTGRLNQINAGPANVAGSFTYYWDGFGNLTERQDGVQNLTEFYCYDNLNRLTNSSIGGTTCTTGTKKTVAYDVSGNITKKSDVSVGGGYTYGANGAGPHALTAIASCSGCTVNGVANPSFVYDGNGNMTCMLAPGQSICDVNAARFMQWTPFNMVSAISQGTSNASFVYDAEHARIKQIFAASGYTPITRYYVNGLGGMSQKDVVNGIATWHDYIVADGKLVGEHISDGSVTKINYFVLDHLGSVATITDGTTGSPTYGQVMERLSYDAWGRHRQANGADDTTCSGSILTARGFTSQEMMDNFCLVNLNARIYDPTIGRFLSPDSLVEQIANLQDLNRYSYVGNNPLSFSDPSGMCFLGCFWNTTIVRSIAAIIVAYFGQYYALPAIEGVEAGEIGTGLATLNAGIAGGLSGYVATGRLNGALYGALEGAAFAGVHVAKADMGIADGSLASGAMHAAVGGLFSMASGSGFKSGFLAAGFADIAGDGGYSQDPAADITSHAIMGGVGSVLGGGKFENGAATGAFGYLFNDMMIGGAYSRAELQRMGMTRAQQDAWLAGQQRGMIRGAEACAMICPLVTGIGDIVELGVVGFRALFSGETWVTVGRWMSKEELSYMRSTGRMLESRNNAVSSVSFPARSETYLAAPKGDVFVEFDVPSSSIGTRAAADGTAKIYGPNSIQGQFYGVTEMPPVRGIKLPPGF